MKRTIPSILILFLLLTACGGPASSSEDLAPTWQEQYDLGVRYLSEGNYEEAIIAFTAAIEIDPKRAEAYLGLADVYVRQGDYDKALEILQQGLEKTGENQDIADKIAEMEVRLNEASIQYPRLYATVTNIAVLPDVDQISRGFNDAAIVEVEYSFDTSLISSDLNRRIHRATLISSYTFNHNIDQLSEELVDNINDSIRNYQEEYSARYIVDGENYYSGERKYPSGEISLHTFSTNQADKIWVLLVIDADGDVLGYSILPLPGYDSSNNDTWGNLYMSP